MTTASNATLCCPQTPSSSATTSFISSLGFPLQNAQRSSSRPPLRRTVLGSTYTRCPQGCGYASLSSSGLFLFCVVQTVDGRPAKSITRSEFIEFMKRARAAFYRRRGSFPHRLRWNVELGLPLYGKSRERFEMPRPKGAPAKDWEDGWLGWDPIFSFDNPSAHGGKGGKLVLPALQLDASDHFELPSNSPDIHRVIERTHARLVGAFNDWLYHDASDAFSMADYMAKLEDLFYNEPGVASRQVIMADVVKLPELYENVIANEGGWADKAFR